MQAEGTVPLVVEHQTKEGAARRYFPGKRGQPGSTAISRSRPVPQDNPGPSRVLQYSGIPDGSQPPDGQQEPQKFGGQGIFNASLGQLDCRRQTGLGQGGQSGLFLRREGPGRGGFPAAAPVSLPRVEV